MVSDWAGKLPPIATNGHQGGEHAFHDEGGKC
jgi:hypothetical protein